MINGRSCFFASRRDNGNSTDHRYRFVYGDAWKSTINIIDNQCDMSVVDNFENINCSVIYRYIFLIFKITPPHSHSFD